MHSTPQGESRLCRTAPRKSPTRAQSRSTASRMSSWCPMRETPSSSSSAWLILSSRSPHTGARSNTQMYCCRQSSRPAGRQGGRQLRVGLSSGTVESRKKKTKPQSARVSGKIINIFIAVVVFGLNNLPVSSLTVWDRCVMVHKGVITDLCTVDVDICVCAKARAGLRLMQKKM